MSKRLFPLIKAFGWKDGVLFFFRRIFKKDGRYYSSRYNTSIYLRNKMADKATFKQVFIQSQYKINFPLVPQTIIDGGANIGLATIYFSHLFPQASIVAVEPNTENFQQMEKNIKTSKNIYPIHGGIWNNNQHLRIVNSNVDDNAFMVEEVPEPTSDSIPAFSIDHLMQINNWSCIDLLKLDIEGSEKEVFEKNYSNWLPKTKMLIIELHDQMRPGASKALFTALSSYNFSFSMHHENVIFINRDLVST
jgi:FkbM family methyltransferase